MAFRIFPEHVEVDVLHSDSQILARGPARSGRAGQSAGGGPDHAGRADRAGQAPGRARGRSARAAAAAGLAPAPAEPVPLGQPGQPATFAEWMSTALRREGLTQEAAARQLGVSVKTVSRWVGGATEPRMRDLRRIQEVFGEVPLP